MSRTPAASRSWGFTVCGGGLAGAGSRPPGYGLFGDEGTMVLSLISRVFGTKHERDIKRMWPLVEEINEQYGRLRDLSDEALRQKTLDFRARIEAGETEDDLLPEAFAVVKETCRRLVGQTW